jgi:hypothetical protein
MSYGHGGANSNIGHAIIGHQDGASDGLFVVSNIRLLVRNQTVLDFYSG